MKRVLLFLPLVFVTLSVCFLGCSSSEVEVRDVRLAHALNTQHPVHKGMIRLAELVSDYSEGSIQMTVFPNQQLGSERQMLELLQLGSIGMTKVSSAAIENFVPDLRVFGLPYLFENEAHILRVLNGEIGKDLLLAGEPYWLRGLTYFDAGKRSFYTKEAPILHPDDLNGLKIRVMESQMSMNMIRVMDGSPTPISFGELYTALQQGVVDGAENNPPSYMTSRHYEVARHYSLDEHTMLPDMLVISTLLWEQLSDEEQGWVQTAADSAARYQRQVWKEAEVEALKIIEEDGVEIHYPDKAPFMEATAALYESYKESDPELYQLIQRIVAARTSPEAVEMMEIKEDS